LLAKQSIESLTKGDFVSATQQANSVRQYTRIPTPILGHARNEKELLKFIEWIGLLEQAAQRRKMDLETIYYRKLQEVPRS
jgi:hypothetical protein